MDCTVHTVRTFRRPVYSGLCVLSLLGEWIPSSPYRNLPSHRRHPIPNACSDRDSPVGGPVVSSPPLSSRLPPAGVSPSSSSISIPHHPPMRSVPIPQLRARPVPDTPLPPVPPVSSRIVLGAVLSLPLLVLAVQRSFAQLVRPLVRAPPCLTAAKSNDALSNPNTAASKYLNRPSALVLLPRLPSTSPSPVVLLLTHLGL